METPIDVVDLLKRAEVLEKALGIQPQPMRAWPAIPGIPNLAPKADNRCAKCGIDWSGTMGYVCGMTDYPVQLRVTC